jgi:hypothetical protein
MVMLQCARNTLIYTTENYSTPVGEMPRCRLTNREVFSLLLAFRLGCTPTIETALTAT